MKEIKFRAWDKEEEEQFSALRGSVETMGDILNWMYYKETSQGEG